MAGETIQKDNRKTQVMLTILLVAVLVAGALLVWWVAIRADRGMRDDLLQQARLVAGAVNIEGVRALTGTEADLGSSEYLSLKEQLGTVRAAHPQCRFVYLMGRKSDGTVFIYADSEPAGSEDESPAGQVYEEISADYLRAFDMEAALTVGPVTDRWGTWVTALAPLADPQTGELIAILGMDIDAQDWRQAVIGRTMLPVGLVLMAMMLVVAVVLMRQRTSELRKSEEQFRFLVDHYSDLIWILKANGVFAYVSPSWKRVLGYEPTHMVGSEFQPFVHPEDVAVCENYMMQALKAGKTLPGPQYRVRHADGAWRWHEGSITPVYAANSSFMYFVGVSRDITERKKTEAALAERLEFEKMVSGISVNFVNLPPERLDEGISYVLQATGEFFNVDRSYLVRFTEDGRYMTKTHQWCAAGIEAHSNRIQKQLVDSLPWWAEKIRKQGHVHIPDVDKLPPEAALEKAEFQDQDVLSLLRVPIKREGSLYGFISFDSVREKREWTEDHIFLLKVIAELIANALVRNMNEETIRRLSFHDQLTGLYNRRYFENELERLDRSREHPIAVISADLDGLKLVNDAIGHAEGDRYLQAGAEFLQNALRSSDILARVGGDEFALLLPRTAKKAAELLMTRVRRQVEEYNRTQKHLPLSISMGLAVSEGADYPLEDIFRAADNNMYTNKLQQSKKARADIVSALLASLDKRGNLAEGDRGQVRELALGLGRVMALKEDRLADLDLLAQVYDLGKVGLPESMCHSSTPDKAGQLTEAEGEVISRHSEMGYRIALTSFELAGVAELVQKHHANYDGTGYPPGLKGKDIPLENRILSIAIAYSAMTNPRPNSGAIPPEKALAEIKGCAGSQFDPQLVKAFVQMMEKKELM